jgi:heme-degrading monooxygenase HmoA
MTDTTDPTKRIATAPEGPHDGAVLLFNCFDVTPSRDDAFTSLWTSTSGYFRAQPGFASLRLHRAVSPDARYRFINVATWDSAQEFYAAHQGDEFFKAVTQPGWEEFPSSPALYEVVVTHNR